MEAELQTQVSLSGLETDLQDLLLDEKHPYVCDGLCWNWAPVLVKVPVPFNCTIKWPGRLFASNQSSRYETSVSPFVYRNAATTDINLVNACGAAFGPHGSAW